MAATKQGEVGKITQQGVPEFKGTGVEVKKEARLTSVLTIKGGKPTRIHFEDGKPVREEEAV